MITYEVKNKDLVNDFIEVNCCQFPSVKFKNIDLSNNKTILSIINLVPDKPDRDTFLIDKILEHT